MFFNYRRAILQSSEAISLVPGFIARAQFDLGHWDGICRVDPDPADADADSLTKPPEEKSSQTKDEPLGESGLKALQAEREQRKALEKQLKAVEQQFKDVDPASYQEAIQRLSEFETKEAERKQKELESQQKYEEALRLTEERYQKQLSDRQTQLSTDLESAKTQAQLYQDALTKIAVDQALQSAFLDKEINGDPASLDLFIQLPSIRSQLKTSVSLDEVTKQPTIKVETPEGESVVDFLKANRSSFLRLCKPDNPNSGGGTPPGVVSSGRSPSGKSFEDLRKKVASR